MSRFISKVRARLSPERESWLIGLAACAALMIAYYALLARGFFLRRYVFPGDTYVHWWPLYAQLYSLKHFGSFMWWDPTSTNGIPLYYHQLSYLTCFLSPFYVVSLMLFKAVSMISATTIYSYMVFHRTIYVTGLLILGLYLASRQVVREPIAAILPPTLFTFSYFQQLNFHDYYAVEAMIAPIFVVFAVLRYARKRDAAGLLLCLLFISVWLASLNFWTVTSPLFWMSMFALAMLWFFPSMLGDLPAVAGGLARTRRGKVLLVLGVMLLASGLAASLAAPYFNAEHFLRSYGPFEYSQASTLSTRPGVVESSELWTLLTHWLPFASVHDQLLPFAWHGHWNRYIGMVTLPLIVAAAALAFDDPYVAVFGLTFFLCNGYLIYTSKNLVYSLLMEKIGVLQVCRNMLTIFPRGGPPLFLMLLSGIGLDRILRLAKTMGPDAAWRARTFAGSLKFLMGAFALLSIFLGAWALKMGWGLADGGPDAAWQHFAQPLWHTFFHAGLYLTAFCFLLALLARPEAQGGDSRKILLTVLFVLTLADLTQSLSQAIDHGDPDGRYPTSGWALALNDPQFHPIRRESEDEFIRYWDDYHSEIAWGLKEWLFLTQSGNGQKFLSTYDANRKRMQEYPKFEFFSNARYIPFEAIADVPRRPEISQAAPLFYLHDRNALLGDAPPRSMAGNYTLLNFAFDSVVMKTKTARDGFLYYLDNYDRFWLASIDGAKTPIYRANFTFKALRLPAGDHVVTWTFNPWPVKAAYTAFYALLAAFLSYLAYCAATRKT